MKVAPRAAYAYEYKNMLQILQRNFFCDFIPIKMVTKQMNEKRLFDLNYNRTVCIRWELNKFPRHDMSLNKNKE